MGQKYLKIENQKPGLLRKQDVAKDGGLEPNVNILKLHVKFYCGGGMKKLM